MIGLVNPNFCLHIIPLAPKLKSWRFPTEVWFTTLQMPLDVRKSRNISMEYKFVIQRAGGWAEWEEGPNRNLPLKLHLGHIQLGASVVYV